MKHRIGSYALAFSLLAGCSSGTGSSIPHASWPAPAAARAGTGYTVHVLATLGGTNSAANTIDNDGWAMGTSFLGGNTTMHATLWKGSKGTAIDLKTLGGPNSAVEWPIENDHGYVAGISETSKKDPLGESPQWSCHAFLPDNGGSGDTCLGFVWHGGTMHALPTLGGNNGYAAGMNDDDQIVGWAETSSRDSTCVAPQKLQFLPAIWNARTLEVDPLPTLTVTGKADPDGAATAANDEGDVVGISGICDQAVGRYTARHAVLWHDGVPMQLQTLGGTSWNTPTAINDRGQIVGFLNMPGSADRHGKPNFISVIWNAAGDKPVKIGALPGDALSEPTAVNAQGDAIGVSFPSSHVYLWSHGTMTDLTKLVLASYPKLALVSVGGINDRGEIAGQACKLVAGACPSTSPALVTFLAVPR